METSKKIKKFKTFLESLKGHDKDDLINVVLEGFDKTHTIEKKEKIKETDEK